MVHRVLITDYVHPILISGLSLKGFRVHYAPEIERPELLKWITGCTGMVVNTKVRIDQELLDRASALKWIGRLGSGLDTIYVEGCASRGIQVVTTPEANANAVAEHVFGMLLSLIRNIVVADKEVRLGIWNREGNRGRELAGRTLGIIGFGNNGSAFAAKFAGWNVRVLAYGKHKRNFVTHLPFVTECDLPTLLKESQILSLHIPLTEETRYLVDADFFARCRRGVILINSARGKVIQLSALLDALDSGHLAGACLDVLENEKPGTYTPAEQVIYQHLVRYPNVVLTPHIAGWTFESKLRIASRIVEAVNIDQ